jgi:hypothetical protein
VAHNIVQAIEAFSSDALGFPRPVAKGETFEQGHPIAKAHPGSFEPWECDNLAETTTAGPGEKRRSPRRKSRKRKQEKASATPSSASSGKAKDASKSKGLSKSDAPGAGKSGK